jgi:predicted CoA-binding protein
MTTTQEVQDFLGLSRIAMVGVSREGRDFSRTLFREMSNRGYEMVAVNPAAAEIEGEPCAPSLHEVQPAVDGVLIMTPARETLRVVQECVELEIQHVWMYRAGGVGAMNPEAVALCKQHNIHVVEGHCPYMFFAHTPFLHRAHGFLLKLTKRYPAAAAK